MAYGQTPKVYWTSTEDAILRAGYRARKYGAAISADLAAAGFNRTVESIAKRQARLEPRTFAQLRKYEEREQRRALPRKTGGRIAGAVSELDFTHRTAARKQDDAFQAALLKAGLVQFTDKTPCTKRPLRVIPQGYVKGVSNIV